MKYADSGKKGSFESSVLHSNGQKSEGANLGKSRFFLLKYFNKNVGSILFDKKIQFNKMNKLLEMKNSKYIKWIVKFI